MTHEKFGVLMVTVDITLYSIIIVFVVIIDGLCQRIIPCKKTSITLKILVLSNYCHFGKPKMPTRNEVFGH